MRRLIFVIIVILGFLALTYGIILADPDLIHRFAANI
jgi:hypothetical protein